MRNLKRILLKSFFHLSKICIGLLAYIHPRWYMKYYTKLLQFAGIQFYGTPRFIAKSVYFDDFNRITIGDRFVASMNVYFLTHDYSYTTALISINQKPETDIGVKRDIKIGNNVFIGMNSIILPGTSIGDNVIIGAGSVVRGAIQPNSICVGNPAFVIGDIKDYAIKIKSSENLYLFKDKS